MGQPSLARTQWCPLVDKMSQEQESLLGHLSELMTEMEYLDGNVFWILHLPRKTEVHYTMFLAGFL